MNKMYIVIEDGMVTDIFSKEKANVEVIDLDFADDFDEREKLEDKVCEIRNSDEFNNIYTY